MSSTASTAYAQGQNEAISAYNALLNLGFQPNVNNNTTIVYDLEAFSPATSACLQAVESFIKGWDNTLAVAPAQVSGVYGSTAASYLSNLTGSPAPRFIWGAKYDGNDDTAALSPVPSTDWSSNARLKQYDGGHYETHGGVTIKMDSDSSAGPLYCGC